MALLMGLWFPLLALHKLGSADVSENLFLSVLKATCMLLQGHRGSRYQLVKDISLTTNSDPLSECQFLVTTPKELPSCCPNPYPWLLLNVRYSGFSSFLGQ